MFVEPTAAFENVAAMRSAFAPRLSGRLVTPDLGGYTYNAGLSALAGVVADLPAAVAAQLDELARSFVDAVADVVEADQVDTDAEPVTRSYATSPSTDDAVGDRWSPPATAGSGDRDESQSIEDEDADADVVLVDPTADEMPRPDPGPPPIDFLGALGSAPSPGQPSLLDGVSQQAATE